MTKPITPDQVTEFKKEKIIPDFVFEAVNYMIAKHFSSGYAIIRQDNLIDKILEIQPNTSRRDIFDNKWLDIEEIYIEAGWAVYYDKPAYNESYEATFKFTKKK
jgi:hypothetical protein